MAGTTFSSTLGKPRSWWWTSSARRAPPTPVSINRKWVEMIDSSNKLDRSDNTEALYRKSRLVFPRRLRSFDVCTRLL